MASRYASRSTATAGTATGTSARHALDLRIRMLLAAAVDLLRKLPSAATAQCSSLPDSELRAAEARGFAITDTELGAAHVVFMNKYEGTRRPRAALQV